ncbi:MAG TPA: ABC transporter substrate-binding protein [Candidatus Egerieimonas intestinavium]|uniref:ABC transporter substrate-binding protein n=1 Tax=Candidatus Egerieimonas intestinavium TaxID=2840777 RepID=A0A9D1JG05_9FIRM|nr:ABC transporter substrate-binding protein [Candidatus Egerieimonas intestinavium]
MKKRVIAAIMGAAMAVSALAGCGGTETKGDSAKGGQETSGEETYKIGISQFAVHGSLDNCREGFLEGLKEEGIEEGKNLEVEVKNAAADPATAAQIADSLVSDKVDLICAIATPSAQSAFKSAMDTDIPVIYTAITSPESAELAGEDGSSVGNITGTSDVLPVEAQLKMIREILPEAETIGILYTTSEANSVYTISQYEEYAKEYGFTIESKGINSTAEISLAAEDLLGQVDCLTNLTDNTVVESLATILDIANEKKIPVFGSEIEQVKLGCLAAEGLDYVALGRQTGKMAAKVLKGEAKASEMPYETIEGNALYVNQAVADNLGITVPDTMTERAEEIFDTIATEG